MVGADQFALFESFGSRLIVGNGFLDQGRIRFRQAGFQGIGRDAIGLDASSFSKRLKPSTEMGILFIVVLNVQKSYEANKKKATC